MRLLELMWYFAIQYYKLAINMVIEIYTKSMEGNGTSTNFFKLSIGSSNKILSYIKRNLSVYMALFKS